MFAAADIGRHREFRRFGPHITQQNGIFRGSLFVGLGVDLLRCKALKTTKLSDISHIKLERCHPGTAAAAASDFRSAVLEGHWYGPKPTETETDQNTTELTGMTASPAIRILIDRHYKHMRTRGRTGLSRCTTTFACVAASIAFIPPTLRFKHLGIFQCLWLNKRVRPG